MILSWHCHACNVCAIAMPCQPTNRLGAAANRNAINGQETCYLLPGQSYPCPTCRKTEKVVYLDRVSPSVLLRIQARRELRIKKLARIAAPTWLRPPKQKFDYEPILSV